MRKLLGGQKLADGGFERSQQLVVQLAWMLGVASKKAHAAYEAHPNGTWGSMVGRLKIKLCELAREVAKEAGVER